MSAPNWHDLGSVQELCKTPLQQIVVGKTRIALSYQDGKFGAISGVCRHVGGPLGEGKLADDGKTFVSTAIVAKCPSKYEMQQKSMAGELAPHAGKEAAPVQNL